jgi:hypothetical protein
MPLMDDLWLLLDDFALKSLKIKGLVFGLIVDGSK